MEWIRRCSLVLVIAIASLASAAPPVKVETEVVPRRKKADLPPARVWPDTQVGRLLKELDDLQRSGHLGEDPWARKLKEIIEVGPRAVPELIVELDATPQSDRLMLRTLPFLLRGIGDKRAIPALIRAIPRTFGNDGSDMGYHTKDPELHKFLIEVDADAHLRKKDAPPETHYSYGRPVREVFGTLERWTKVDNGWVEINFISDDSSSTPRQRWLKQRLYAQCAERWADWWAKHWSEFVDDPALSQVGLSRESSEEPPSPFLDVNRPLKHEGGHSGNILEPFTGREARDIFLDLDTGRSGGLPPEWKAKTDEELRSGEEQLVAWARDQGFELMGVERTVDGKPQPAIRTVQLDLWEVAPELWNQRPERTAQQTIDSGRWAGQEIVHVNRATEAAEPDAPGYFFFLTTEGTPGLLHLGVPVLEGKWVPGKVAAGDLELDPTGHKRGRRFGRRSLSPGE
jgi:hypothetical protein